jgi:hypothetical protein
MLCQWGHGDEILYGVKYLLSSGDNTNKVLISLNMGDSYSHCIRFKFLYFHTIRFAPQYAFHTFSIFALICVPKQMCHFCTITHNHTNIT